MEQVIDRLLEQFEKGRMSRRDLVRSLAVTAAAVAGVTPVAARGAQTAATSALGPAPWKTVWLGHISYAVSDYKRSVDFYSNLMGWKVLEDNGTSQATLDLGGIGTIIIRNGRRQAADAEPARQGRPPITGVVNHISYGIDPWDTDAVKAELERRGLTPRPDMVGDDFKSYHVTDPDGWDLQISNEKKGS